MSTEYTVAQIEAAIPDAIAAHDFTAAVSLVNMLAVRDPQRARTMLNAIHASIGHIQAVTQ